MDLMVHIQAKELQLNNKTQQGERAKDSSISPTKDLQMTRGDRRCSVSLVMREMQIKPRRRHHLTPSRMASGFFNNWK